MMRMSDALLVGTVLIATVLASPAWSAAPQPRKPFDIGHMAGRWYEIAHTPTALNRDCQAGTTDWTPAGSGKFRIVATCRKGSLTGPARVISGTVKITDPVSHAKVRMLLFGGLIGADYWLIDRADDYAWLIMGTPGGAFVSIMASRPTLPAAMKSDALLDARRLGYDVSKLSFPAQPAGD